MTPERSSNIDEKCAWRTTLMMRVRTETDERGSCLPVFAHTLSAAVLCPTRGLRHACGFYVVLANAGSDGWPVYSKYKTSTEGAVIDAFHKALTIPFECPNDALQALHEELQDRIA